MPHFTVHITPFGLDWIPHVTTRADAIKAASIYKTTQIDLDAIKDTIAANSGAKKILGAYMMEQSLNVFRGVTLRVVAFDAWDNAKLRAYLGDKIADFRQQQDRKYFGLSKRASQ
jgi:hypothetical protein